MQTTTELADTKPARGYVWNKKHAAEHMQAAKEVTFSKLELHEAKAQIVNRFDYPQAIISVA